MKRTEPYTPWSNAAEAAIRELKKGVGQQMVQSKAPKRLWDDCLERYSYVRSLTAHEIYRLDGHVRKKIVSGETADLSPFATFKWYTNGFSFETHPSRIQMIQWFLAVTSDRL